MFLKTTINSQWKAVQNFYAISTSKASLIISLKKFGRRDCSILIQFARKSKLKIPSMI